MSRGAYIEAVAGLAAAGLLTIAPGALSVLLGRRLNQGDARSGTFDRDCGAR